MTEGEQLFHELQDFIFETAVPNAGALRFDKRDKYTFAVIAAYLSILEKAWAILALVNENLGAQSQPLLRAQFETFADLSNLLSDRDYLKHLELMSEKSTHKRLIAAKSGNPYLTLVAEHFATDQELSKVGTTIKDLEALGAKSLEPGERIKKAGLQREYEALYPALSDHVHGGLNSWVSRHFSPNEGDFEVVAFPVESFEDSSAQMQTAFDILLRASVLIHDHFESGQAEIFRTRIEEHLKRNDT